MLAKYINKAFLIMSVTLKGNIITDSIFYIKVYKKSRLKEKLCSNAYRQYGLHFAIGSI